MSRYALRVRAVNWFVSHTDEYSDRRRVDAHFVSEREVCTRRGKHYSPDCVVLPAQLPTMGLSTGGATSKTIYRPFLFASLLLVQLLLLC
jgi:hypothetical protein